MRVVVTGGTGFVGRALVRRLLAEGHSVRLLTRDVARAAARAPARCTLVSWDPSRPQDGVPMAGVDAVVHLAGAGIADARWTADRRREICESRVVGTRAVVRAIAALPAASRPRVLVSASAVGWYGDRGDETLAEDAPRGSGFLADVCQAWEREAVAAAALGVGVTAVRIGIVLGRDGGALARVLPPFRLGLGGRLGTGRQWMSWIHLDDLVALLVWAAGYREGLGVLNGVAPAPARNAEFTAALARTLGRLAVMPVPALALRIALGDLSTVLLASQRVVPAAATQLGFRFRYPTIDTALAECCAEPLHEESWEQWLPAPPEAVFPFFSDPRNLEAITPDFLRFRVLQTSTSTMQEGTRIDYQLSLRGLPLRWQSVIEAWEPPQRFVDRQTRGPYTLWHHTHEFEPRDGGTLIRDRVRWAVPLGTLGDLVAGGWVARDVDAIFAFRRAKLAAIFGSGHDAPAAARGLQA